MAESTRAWAKERLCILCGARDWEPNGRRKFCSSRCSQLHRRAGGNVPRQSNCTKCGVTIDLFEESPKSGRKRRADTLLCRTCHRSRYLRHGVSAMELFNRDGAGCSICGSDIDMTLRHPDLLSATVDHVLPVSRGGGHEPENLALAHLTCNVTKQSRVGWKPAA